MTYVLGPISAADRDLLAWMADRGYDGGIYDRAEHDVDDSGRYVLTLTESAAWAVAEYVDEDPDAFGTCCGSSDLCRALSDLLLSIV